MGGSSAEREISLESGNAVLAALLRRGIDAHAVYADSRVLSRLLEGGFDRAFIALHGRGGEDGVIQGGLETIVMPFTGSGVLGSALAMDKSRSKALWLQAGIPTPEYIEINGQTDLKQVCNKFGLPLMVKPVREGSSFGASKVTSGKDIEDAWLNAYQFDERVMAECWIEGAEYTVPILNDEVLPLIKLETPREFYDYKAKYEDSSTRYICPCGLETEKESELGQIAFAAYKLLDASGWGRVDLLLDKTGRPWVIEVNTVPGMTSHSLVPMAAAKAGINFDELVTRILATSMHHGKHKQRVST
ncbi:MAG: D-alanine--D-alanine ligase [Gammaproteobacteria bacterium RBG_16_51_14]|nr:MAG: D-alanine--D-alanine ligase [Gammaproteobacteria bacterium RBG_16_51_14]